LAVALRKSPLARRDYLDDEDDASTSEIKDKHLGKILSVLEEMHKARSYEHLIQPDC